MKRVHSISVIALTAVMGLTAISAPVIASASEQGKRDARGVQARHRRQQNGHYYDNRNRPQHAGYRYRQSSDHNGYNHDNGYSRDNGNRYRQDNSQNYRENGRHNYGQNGSHSYRQNDGHNYRDNNQNKDSGNHHGGNDQRWGGR